MAEDAKTIETIDLLPINLDDVTITGHIRSTVRHSLFAYTCDQGILFYDRRSGLQHIWTWERVRAILPVEEK